MTETAEQLIQSLEQHLSSQPKSPLFAQLADCYLEAGRPQEALTLCDRGLAQYPFYTTGHLIKGRALLALNMKSEARREFEFVHDALPLNEAVAKILSQIPQGEEEPFRESRAGVAETPEKIDSSESITAPPQPAEPSSAEAASEQWMAQFTEAGLQNNAPQATVESQPSEETSPQIAASLSGDETPFQADEAVAETAGEESFEQFSERKRGEFFGLEGSMPLEDYLNETPAAPVETGGDLTSGEPLAPEGPSEEFTAQEPVQDPFASLPGTVEETSEMPAAESAEDPFAALPQVEEQAPNLASSETTDEDPFAQLTQAEPEPIQAGPEERKNENQIEEIAEKLKDAKKITPIINFAEKETTSPSDAETPSGSGFVTPTLAEIYAKQGWYDDAIKAYKALAHSKPLEKDKFEQRIRELEELKKQQDSIG